MGHGGDRSHVVSGGDYPESSKEADLGDGSVKGSHVRDDGLEQADDLSEKGSEFAGAT